MDIEDIGLTQEERNIKLANLPTIDRLLSEPVSHTFSPEELVKASDIVADLIAANPTSEKELHRKICALRKTYKCDCRKILLLAGYRRLQHQHAINEETTSLFPTSHQPLHLPPPSSSLAIPILNNILHSYLIRKLPRSQSGVLVITVFTSPYPSVDNDPNTAQPFSCEWDCFYCPNEPGQPRSYLLNEAGVRRANIEGFDPVRQVHVRLDALVQLGHTPDKLEILVLGGTWESYPKAYREQFVRDIFFAANTYREEYGHQTAIISSTNDTVPTLGDIAERARPPPTRGKLDLLSEQWLNESVTSCRIIGLTLETRPDTINTDMIQHLRRLGCTRVQLGIQHTDHRILKLVNRQSTPMDAVRALRLLHDACFKVDVHLMPDLPGTTPELDRQLFDRMIDSPDLQADQWKIYPCQTVPFSVLEQWVKDGSYTSYGMPELIDVLLYAKHRIPPYIRLNRVIRDIPHEYVLEGVHIANLRQLLQARMKQQPPEQRGDSDRWPIVLKEVRKLELKDPQQQSIVVDSSQKGVQFVTVHSNAQNVMGCRCIRCREVRSASPTSYCLFEREYTACRGIEVFISIETPNEETILGFLRLRFPRNDTEVTTVFPELKSAALIRELHVYGNLKRTNIKHEGILEIHQRPSAQHVGLGRCLLEQAERLSMERGYSRVAVIAGVGVRHYYRKRGYVLQQAGKGAFMIKQF